MGSDEFSSSMLSGDQRPALSVRKRWFRRLFWRPPSGFSLAASFTANPLHRSTEQNVQCGENISVQDILLRSRCWEALAQRRMSNIFSKRKFHDHFNVDVLNFFDKLANWSCWRRALGLKLEAHAKLVGSRKLTIRNSKFESHTKRSSV